MSRAPAAQGRGSLSRRQSMMLLACSNAHHLWQHLETPRADHKGAERPLLQVRALWGLALHKMRDAVMELSCMLLSGRREPQLGRWSGSAPARIAKGALLAMPIAPSSKLLRMPFVLRPLLLSSAAIASAARQHDDTCQPSSSGRRLLLRLSPSAAKRTCCASSCRCLLIHFQLSHNTDVLARLSFHRPVCSPPERHLRYSAKQLF
mmetsp:Transcript_9725/g.15539  ORF Transcript_9725/g.15539 Transcript_9725/m.15539 type:complete len:206 (+) Transcript_9725:1934-2551(+)